MQEGLLERAPLSARAIALYYLELHVRSRIRLSEIQNFLQLKHVQCLIRIKQSYESKRWLSLFLFGMCDCVFDFSHVLGTLHMYEHVQVRSHVSPGMDCLHVKFF